jgi:hypothetical protein
MRDADQQYPHQKRGGNGSRQPFDDDTEVEIDDNDDFQEPVSPQLPQNRFTKALIIGIVAGIIAALQGIIFTLANASLYHTVSTTPQDKLSLDLAEAIFGLFCLNLFISLLIYFIAGFVTGKAIVERKMGFLVGFVAAAVSFILSLIVQQIPGYPNARGTGLSGGLSGLAGGLLTILILLAISGVIGGFVSLVGAWLATRKHPYYYASQGS